MSMRVDFIEALLKNPLSDHSRRLKRNLLIFAVASIVLVKFGLVPTKIENLGIVFSQENKEALLTILKFVCIYYLVAFYINMYADSSILLLHAMKSTAGDDSEKLSFGLLKRYYYIKGAGSIWKDGKGLLVTGMLRTFIETTFPLLFCLYALYLLDQYNP